MKKLIAFGFICALPFVARAEIIINEIMYDLDGTDTDREWIEVLNTSSAAVDLSTYKFFEGNTNHSLVPDGSASIPAGGFAIIADTISKFKTDWPNFSGILFDSSFSLNNDPGETLAMKDATNTIVNQVTYVADPSGAGAGKSLQKNGENWVIAAPTPGATNATTSDVDAGGDNANGGSGGSSTTPTTPVTKKPVEQTVQKMTAEMIVKQVAITNIEVVFEPKVLAPSGEVIRRGKFAWNFGDGASVMKETNEKVVHTYKKSGDYVVTLDYFMNPYIASTTSDAGDRVILTVEDHKLAITSFDEAGNITLQNADTKEFDLSGWSLSLGSKQFAFAYNSIILPGKSLFLAASVTGFAGADHTLPLVLVGKDGTIAFTFNNARSSAARVSSRAPSSSSLSLPTEIPEEQKTEITPAIPLSAQAVDTQSDETRGSSATISIVTLAIMLALSIGITLYIRRRKRGEPENADDIAIVD